MLKEHARAIGTFHLLMDMILTVLAFEGAYLLRVEMAQTTLVRYASWFKEFYRPIMAFELYQLLLFLILPLWALLLYSFGSYRSQRLVSMKSQAWALFQAVFSGGVLLVILIFFTRIGGIDIANVSRTLIISFVIINYILLLSERLVARQLLSYWRRRGYNFRTVLVIGSGEQALKLAGLVDETTEWGLKMLGFATDDEEVLATGELDGRPVMGHITDMEQIIHRNVVDEVIFAVPRTKLWDMEDIFLLCEEEGIRTWVAANFFPHLVAKIQLDDLQGLPLLTYTTTPTNEFMLLVKRIFDLGVALVMLIIHALPMLAIAAAIKLTSRGPVFFRQERLGLHGRPFTMLKFRSMVADAEARKAQLASSNEMNGPAFKMKHDPRVTWVGRIIRTLSLDELPQMFNVLLGQMSLVGPRPAPREEIENYERWQRRRLSMKPGITCFWQIAGRNKVDFDEWMRLDLQYIDNWSFGLDLKILLKTIPAVFLARGAS
jgi:exopolysaccharide biosynthesis polyprenyl glycosylphosphotransferase